MRGTVERSGRRIKLEGKGQTQVKRRLLSGGELGRVSSNVIEFMRTSSLQFDML